MKIRFNILFIFCTLLAFGQSNAENPFSKRKPGIMRFYTGISAPKEKTPDKFDRFNTDFFWNSWLGNQNGAETKFYAIGHNINLMFDIPFSKKSVFGIAIGLGYSHFNIRNNGEFSTINSLTSPSQYTQLAPYAGPKRWINRSVFNFLEVPFELRFRAKRERGKFKFYPGFKAGFMFENYSKWRVDNQEFKQFNFPDLNRFHYGPTLRIGVDNVMLFGYYDMSELFLNPESSKLQLFAVGISIGWF